MTVCIAAVCGNRHENGPFIITAADRMITIGQLEYEPAQTKTVNLASHTVGLLAGDMQLHAAIVPRVMARIKSELESKSPPNIDVSQVADFYAEEFGYYRRSMAEREILVPRGLSFDRFLARQSTMAHYQVAELDARLVGYHIGSVAIIAGIDRTGAHLYRIEDPGIALCYDTPFFACIGSGESLAATQFMVKKFDKNWGFSEALWLIYEAKARAEAAGGVGQQTDMVLIGRTGGIISLNKTQLNILRGLYDDVVKKESAIAAEAAQRIHEYVESQRENRQPPEEEHSQTEATSTEPQKVGAPKRPKTPKKD